MPRIVAAGTENAAGNNPTTVAVVDASDPANPQVVMVSPNIGLTGARVGIDGGLLAVGAVLSGVVALFDVTKPATPVAKGTPVNTQLAGIGAINVRGTLVAVGEWTNLLGARVKLIDGSSGSPVVVSTATTPLASNTNTMMMGVAAITSIAFLSDTLVLAAGPGSGQIVLIDFTNRMNPVVSAKPTTFAGVGSADGDAAGQRIAAGDGSGGQVRLFDAAGTLLGTQSTPLGSIGSVSLNAPLAIAASPNSSSAALIDFGMPPISFNAQLGGGATTAIHAPFIALGSITGPFGQSLGRIQFWDAADLKASANAPPLGHADVALASISTLAIGETTDVTASPSPLDFGTVAAGATPPSQSVTVKNTGTIARHVTAVGIATAVPSSGAFALVPPPPVPITLAANGGTATIAVGFTAGTSLGPANGTLSLTTDDPAAQHITVSLTGRVGAAAAAFSPAIANFGSVAVCLSKDVPVSLANNGNLPLSVTAATITGDPRLSVTTAMPLMVAPGSSKPLTIRFAPAGVAGAIPAAATLSLTSNDPAAPTLSFSGTAVASPPALALNAPPVLSFGTIPVNSLAALSLTLSNASACTTLTLTLSTAGAPFTVASNLAATLVAVGGVSLTPPAVAPGGSAIFAVVFAPTVAGAFNGTLSIAHNDPSRGPVTIPLTGSAVVTTPTALELVLDHSGSMSDTVPGGTKMTSLHDAVGLFAEVIPFGNGDELGAVKFDSTASVIAARASWTAAQQSAVTSAVNALTPQLSTSIGAGLNAAVADLSASSVARRAILVFTDGMENTAPMIAQVLPGISSAGIEVYAVGLGRPMDISTAALSALAASSKGKFFDTSDMLVLRKQFLQVLADSFRQNVAADPIAVVTPGGKATLAVDLNSCDRSATFCVNWENPQSILQVQLVTPQGTVLTASSAALTTLVQVGQGSTYAWYRVRFAPLDPGSGQFLNPAPAGTWTLEADGTGLAGNSERVGMSVLVDSDLTLDLDVTASDASSPIAIAARLLHGSNPLTGARVKARITPPRSSLSAATTPSVVAQALAADQHGGRPLRSLPAGAARTTQMTYSQQARAYLLRVPPPGIDGVYQIEIFADGGACNGQFNRYAVASIYVAPRASGSRSTITVTPGETGTGVVAVVPKTAANEPLGPGFSHLIRATVSGKGAASDVADLGNGTYVFRVSWNPRAKNPSVTVVIAGQRRTVPITPRRRSRPRG